MSKICVICVPSIIDNKNYFISRIKQIVDHYGSGCFILEKIEEPFFDYNNSEFIISFSDSYVYDNCEMLLLPDNCTYNGKTNKTPFCDRMAMIRDVAAFLRQAAFHVELYVGDSGTEYDDYLCHKCRPYSIPDVMCEYLNDSNFHAHNLHIVVE